MEFNLKGKNILVVGDIMLDHYVMGEVERISAEAPVPIVHVEKEYSTLGGCGHVASSIKELGANVFCLASIGHDQYGKRIVDLLDEIQAFPMLVMASKNTIVKERVIANQRKIQMIRIDRETIQPVDSSFPIGFLKEYDEITYDIIVVSDYGKGMITKDLMNFLHKLEIRIIVDPKPKNFKLYSDVFMITPNEKEWEEIIKITLPRSPNSMNYILLTEGKNGMTLVDNQDESKIKIHSDPVEVYNVSGAGDTVVSIMAVCLSMGWNVIDSAHIANKCAAYVVTQVGTSIVPKDLFFEIVKNYKKGII